MLTGLAQAPRCSGPADGWAASLLEGLRAAQSEATVALLTRTDENQMRAVAIARKRRSPGHGFEVVTRQRAHGSSSSMLLFGWPLTILVRASVRYSRAPG